MRKRREMNRRKNTTHRKQEFFRFSVFFFILYLLLCVALGSTAERTNKRKWRRIDASKQSKRKRINFIVKLQNYYVFLVNRLGSRQLSFWYYWVSVYHFILSLLFRCSSDCACDLPSFLVSIVVRGRRLAYSHNSSGL